MFKKDSLNKMSFAVADLQNVFITVKIQQANVYQRYQNREK
jgi:hypothetical protein